MYGNQGPCLDVAVRQDILAGELTSGKTKSNSSLSGDVPRGFKQHVIEERFAEINGAVFKEFDRIYRGQGGTDGGWESSKDKL